MHAVKGIFKVYKNQLQIGTVFSTSLDNYPVYKCESIVCVSYHRWRKKKTATSAKMVGKVKKQLDQNPPRSGQKMERKLNISQYAIRQILSNELYYKTLKIQKVRLLRAKELLRMAENGELPNLGFCDEQPFVIQQ